MNCAIAEGYEQDCNKDSIGGVSEVMLGNLADINNITTAVGGAISIDMKVGKQFYKFKTVKNTSSFSNAITTSPTNGSLYYAQSATLVFNKMQLSTSKLVDALCRASLVAIFKDKNGEYTLLGRVNGLDVTGGTFGSGTGSGDRNGYELQLAGEERDISHVDPANIASLLVPGT
jgi:hypothetical protein